jgi:hypothetical protein
LASDVQLLVERSSAHPVEHAVVLLVCGMVAGDDAMYAVEPKLLREWRDTVHGWEHLQ